MMPLIWLCTLNVRDMAFVVRVQTTACTHVPKVFKVLNRVLNMLNLVKPTKIITEMFGDTRKKMYICIVKVKQ